jgi:hypothetical protein
MPAIPTISDLRSMDPSQLRGALVAINEAISAIDADDNAEMRDLSKAEEAELERLMNLHTRCTAHLEMRSQLDRTGATPCMSGDRQENGHRDASDLPPHVRTARDEQMRAIDRVTDQQAIDNASATRVERLIKHEDTPTGLGARTSPP